MPTDTRGFYLQDSSVTPKLWVAPCRVMVGMQAHATKRGALVSLHDHADGWFQGRVKCFRDELELSSMVPNHEAHVGLVVIRRCLQVLVGAFQLPQCVVLC